MDFITMALPSFGPVIRYIGSSTSMYERRQNAYTQTAPYNVPLAYLGWSRRVLLASPASYYDTQNLVFGSWLPNSVAGYQYAINETASKLRSQVSDTALWAVNIAEYHQSLGMMAKRLGQITGLARALLKRDASAAAHAIGLDGKKMRGGIRKNLADTWLEWSFGWKPLIADIYSTIDLLQNPIKAVHLKATKTFSVAFSNGTRGGPVWDARTIVGKDVCRMGCEVTINNPNLYLANNLGLVNPAVWVWELIPFSFCVDWIANVGQFLQSGTDWLGLTVTKPYTTYGSVRTCVREGYNQWDNPAKKSSIIRAHWVERRLSILETQLIVKPLRLWGWQRTANAASVAYQAMSAYQGAIERGRRPIKIRDR